MGDLDLAGFSESLAKWRRRERDATEKETVKDKTCYSK